MVALKQPNNCTPKESIIVPAKPNTPSNQAVTSQPPKPATATNNVAKQPSEANNIALLKEYKELLDNGVITQEEFEFKKKNILSR